MQDVRIVVEQLKKDDTGESAGRQLRTARWGLIPRWAKDPTIGSRLINARSETVSERPSYRDAFRQRRCLIPADGLYEWKKEGKTKQPYRFTMADGAPFAFAGLWEEWIAPDGTPIRTCTVLTTEPNDLIAP